MIAFFTSPQLRDDAFGLALGAPLPTQTRATRDDDADEILNPIRLAVFGKVNDLNKGDLLISDGGCRFGWGVGDDDRARVHLEAEESAYMEPAKCCSIGDSNLVSVNAEFHASRIAQMFLFVNDRLQKVCTQRLSGKMDFW